MYVYYIGGIVMELVMLWKVLEVEEEKVIG